VTTLKVFPPSIFAGRTLSFADASSVRLAETSYAPGEVLRQHAHERPHFCFVVHGDYVESSGAHEYNRSTASLMFLPAGVAHSEAHRQTGRHFMIELSPRFVDGVTLPAALTEIPPRSAVLMAARLHAHFRMNEHVDEEQCLDLVWELLAFLDHHDRHPERWLERARSAIHDHYAGTIRLSWLARDAGVHPVYLAQQFRKVFGCTVGDYVRQLRVEHARRALAGGRSPISAIALDAGFSDQSHLSRHFRRALGTTPAAYREAVGNKQRP